MANKSDDDEPISLEVKYRKEKRELQAEIQALKKAAKNDKTKKKELNAEIARVMFALEECHKKELELKQEISLSSTPEGAIEDLCDGFKSITTVKISKAQKRRDKKTQQEKDREEEIKTQEKKNSYGPRNLENSAITSRLSHKNLKTYHIPSDGDCLYKAIAHQLEIKYNKKITADDLRNQVSSYILENKDYFMPFLTNTETFEMLSDAEFEEYCDKIKNTKMWGGQVEMRAMSKSLSCPITVIQATEPGTIEQGTEFTGPALIISYHRHLYSLGEHYNSTVIINQDNTKSKT